MLSALLSALTLVIYLALVLLLMNALAIDLTLALFEGLERIMSINKLALAVARAFKIVLALSMCTLTLPVNLALDLLLFLKFSSHC